MDDRKTLRRIWVTTVMIILILALHYFTYPHLHYLHAVYRMLFYVPLILGSFWFGLKGALGVSASVTLFYVPFAVTQWQGFSFNDFNRLLEGALYVTIGLVLGHLVEKERRKHRKLLDSESLAAIGRALSEVAHDMKTPLVAIGGFATQVRSKPELDDLNRKKLDVVIRETGRLEAMVRGMLELGRPLELKRSRTDLNQLVLETLEVAGMTARESDVELHADLESTLPSLLLDTPRIRQVLLNLVTNAVQASPAGGDVLIATRHGRGRVVFEVTDHGCGIPKESLKTIFQPFASKKKGGTGLGLAIVKKIVDAHGGGVSFRSNPEKGVTFSAAFPEG